MNSLVEVDEHGEIVAWAPKTVEDLQRRLLYRRKAVLSRSMSGGWLPIGHAAHLSGIPYKTVLYAIHTGRILAHRSGRHTPWYVPKIYIQPWKRWQNKLSLVLRGKGSVNDWENIMAVIQPEIARLDKVAGASELLTQRDWLPILMSQIDDGAK